jgi:CHAT domain
MKTITIEIGELANGHYPLRLYEVTEAGRNELASEDKAIPEDLKPERVQGDPRTFGEFILAKSGSQPVLKQMGSDLSLLLTPGEIGVMLRRLREETEKFRTLLEVKPEALQALPWELLFDGKSRFALDINKTLIRSHSYQRKARIEPYTWPLRALIVIASKDSTIKADEELRLIEEAVRPVNRTIDVEPLWYPTKLKMLDEIKKNLPHILHFIGHSGQNANDEMVLWLEHDGGRDFWTADEIYIDLTGRQIIPRFVFLNSCRSGSAVSLEDQKRALNLSNAFRNAGVPAVLSMQADVKGDHAGLLAGKIYEELSNEKPLDVALALGRIEVQTNITDGLNNREWAAPVLSVSVPPEEVLPIKRRVTDAARVKKIRNCPKFIEVIPPFVNRTYERRSFFQSFYPISPDYVEHHLAVVTGDSEMGKSWMACWCMEGCAWQNHNVRYIEVVNDKSKDWLDVLLQIRDGDEEERENSTLHEPLNPESFHDFNWELHYRLQGQSPPVREGQVIEPPQRGERVVGNLVSSNRDFVELTFTSFRQSLQSASGGNPLILVLDHFTRGDAVLETASMTEMINKLIRPVANGDLKPIKIVLILTKTEYYELYKIEEKLPKPLFPLVELNGIKKEKFDALASEFLQSQNLSGSKEELIEYIQAWKKLFVRNEYWEPARLKKLYKDLATNE